MAKPALANGCPMTMEELVEDVIRSINGIRTSTPETARLHPAIPTALFFALAYCLIYAAINSVDAVSYTHLDVYKRQPLGHGRLNARRFHLAKENLGLSDDPRRAHNAFFRPLKYLGTEPFRCPFYCSVISK